MLIDGEGFPRCLYPMRRLTLVKHRLPILRGARSGTIKKAWEAYGLTKKFADSRPAQKMAQNAKRASLNDLERFSVMINRKRRSFAVRSLAKKGGAAKTAPPAKGKAAPAKGKK